MVDKSPTRLLGSLMMMLIMMMNCFLVWLREEGRLALFPVGTTVRGPPHHQESTTRCEQDLNLRRA